MLLMKAAALIHRTRLALGVALLGALADPASADARVTTVEYKKVDGKSLLLDVGVPEAKPNPEGSLPVVIVVHGGGWGSGDRKTAIRPVLKTLSRSGYLFVSVDYRLSPEYRWPACRDDVDDAVAWTKAHVAAHGGDPDRIAILGYSAGGQLAFWAAIRDQPPHKLKALIGLAPATDLLEDLGRRGGPSVAMRDLMDYREDQPFEKVLLKMYEASPINALHDKLPPILLIHGSADQSVPFQQSVHVQMKIKEAKWDLPCEIHRIEGAPHRQSEWDKFDEGYKAKLAAWLGEHL